MKLLEWGILDFCDFILCGHVHEKWTHVYIDDKPIINVGTDVWNFAPINLQEILVYYDKIIAEKNDRSE